MSENRDSCEMVRIDVPHEHLFDEVRPIGAFGWNPSHLGMRWLVMKLPDGGWCSIPVGPRAPEFLGPVWDWDGNEDRPTVTPSVWVHGRWHGFITAGRMVSC